MPGVFLCAFVEVEWSALLGMYGDSLLKLVVKAGNNLLIIEPEIQTSKNKAENRVDLLKQKLKKRKGNKLLGVRPHV
ncbi:uncharacterized protein YegP (UPF0339 family) [Fictibacillus barbaricus]|uniref:Uncharacterized protein YegP (UPF0339 family) n=1 Tax=Fictibacillus barbaricus TaxID=182136 RepID=A0ABU1U594_9BACL|nr:uncharacterized protein YegP (UPF0339 family) [Fictibacillus barbaricus]